MTSLLGRFAQLRSGGVLGLNARNALYVLTHNERRLYGLVDDKIRCKERLSACGLAVPELLGRVRTQRHAAHLRRQLEGLSQVVIKPANGSGGDGILVLAARRGRYWVSPTGRLYEADEIQYHVSGILNGMYSLAGLPDEAMLEALVHPMPILTTLAPEGIPDIRVIVYRGVPAMAMIRLPTRRSGGKANLHQGAIGAGIDLREGRTSTAVMDNRVVDVHPDTGAPLADFLLPGWQDVLALTARCHDAVGLGYLGVDIVLDARSGPLVLELNARPGLGIQIANRRGLRRLLELVDTRWAPGMTVEQRVALGQELAA